MKYIHFNDILEMIRLMSDNQMKEVLAFIKIEQAKRDKDNEKRQKD